eukprot:gnl/MRDRNA2_/MRDRNA2_51724_c0_seq1.p1 gnl/MRDRNA2_/MRDRNA2_51724_c0~~gnl/MRDRNA2_/MRDRNA2_51724_c0_seq1.p1  ORF type:complete len:263 (+),score=35.68 gnl/MRDRNA2_/MRDRNA2_51724_c0_seq1:49-789(+)
MMNARMLSVLSALLVAVQTQPQMYCCNTLCPEATGDPPTCPDGSNPLSYNDCVARCMKAPQVVITNPVNGMNVLNGTVASATCKHSELPDKSCTPGAHFTGSTGCGGKPCTAATLCVPGYSRSVRKVSDSEKKAVYASYGLSAPRTGFCDGSEGCEVDHLISLEIGGSNDQSNLWPQPYFGEWNAHIKDRLENKLKELFCDGKISLTEAQTCIADNWKTCYTKYVGNAKEDWAKMLEQEQKQEILV